MHTYIYTYTYICTYTYTYEYAWHTYRSALKAEDRAAALQEECDRLGDETLEIYQELSLLRSQAAGSDNSMHLDHSNVSMCVCMCTCIEMKI